MAEISCGCSFCLKGGADHTAALRVPYAPPMAHFLFRVGTILALAVALAPAGVSNRDARSEPRSERRAQGRPAAHAFQTAADRSGAAAAPDPIGAEYTAGVVGIADGDTIRVLHDNREVRIRLHGIDCPEKGQAFGTRAKQFTADLVFGKDVRICVRDIDRYGRTVAEVWLEDGRMLNRELVGAGLAWWYRSMRRTTRRCASLSATRAGQAAGCERTRIRSRPGSGGIRGRDERAEGCYDVTPRRVALRSGTLPGSAIPHHASSYECSGLARTPNRPGSDASPQRARTGKRRPAAARDVLGLEWSCRLARFARRGTRAGLRFDASRAVAPRAPQPPLVRSAVHGGRKRQKVVSKR